MAAQPRHFHRLLAFLDPLLRGPALVLEPHYRPAQQGQIGHDEAHSREQLPRMMLGPRHHRVAVDALVHLQRGAAALMEADQRVNHVQAPVRRPHRVISRRDGQFCGSQVRITAGLDLIFRFLPVATLILSLVFFDDQEGDVVSLRHALSEFLNGFQELLLERMTS